jgi:hypothetical protein
LSFRFSEDEEQMRETKNTKETDAELFLEGETRKIEPNDLKGNLEHKDSKEKMNSVHNVSLFGEEDDSEGISMFDEKPQRMHLNRNMIRTPSRSILRSGPRSLRTTTNPVAPPVLQIPIASLSEPKREMESPLPPPLAQPTTIPVLPSIPKFIQELPKEFKKTPAQHSVVSPTSQPSNATTSPSSGASSQKMFHSRVERSDSNYDESTLNSKHQNTIT